MSAPYDADHYLGLITSFHRGKPKFSATVKESVNPLVELQAFYQSVPMAFDVDVAVGAQLDAVGEHVGISRFIPSPIRDPWFRFDDGSRGWDRGIWRGPFDPGVAWSRLDDDTYRKLIFAKITANRWDGTPASALAALRMFIDDPATLMFIQDNHDMTDSIGVAGALPPIVYCFLLEQNLIPVKTMGVQRSYFFTSVNNSPLFGFDMSNSYVAGWDTGAWGVSATTLLNQAG